MTPEEIQRKLMELGFRKMSATGAEREAIERQIADLERRLALARMR